MTRLSLQIKTIALLGIVCGIITLFNGLKYFLVAWLLILLGIYLVYISFGLYNFQNIARKSSIAYAVLVIVFNIFWIVYYHANPHSFIDPVFELKLLVPSTVFGVIALFYFSRKNVKEIFSKTPNKALYKPINFKKKKNADKH